MFLIFMSIIALPTAVFADLAELALRNYLAFSKLFKIEPVCFAAEFKSELQKASLIKSGYLFIIGAKL